MKKYLNVALNNQYLIHQAINNNTCLFCNKNTCHRQGNQNMDFLTLVCKNEYYRNDISLFYSKRTSVIRLALGNLGSYQYNDSSFYFNYQNINYIPDLSDWQNSFKLIKLMKFYS